MPLSELKIVCKQDVHKNPSTEYDNSHVLRKRFLSTDTVKCIVPVCLTEYVILHNLPYLINPSSYYRQTR